MFFEGKAVCHDINAATRFSAETFFDAHGMNYRQSGNGIWLAFEITWCLVFTGYHNRLKTYLGSAFNSDDWKQLADTNGVLLRHSGVEDHRFLRVNKKYHNSHCHL